MQIFYSYESTNLAVTHKQDKSPIPAEFFMHTHDVAEILIFISGRGVFHIEGSEYPLHSGDIMIMRPAESHYIEINKNEPYERLVINFRIDIFDEIDPERRLTRPFTDRNAGCMNRYNSVDFENDNYRIFMENIISDSKDKRIQIISNLIPLLNEICRAFEKKNDLQSENLSTERQIIQYINSNLTSDITLDSLCKKFYISKPQLCRAFKKATGTTVWEYISVKRLIYIRSRIQSGGNPTKIFSECGFNDYSSFYRAYIKKFGCSPKADMPERQ